MGFVVAIDGPAGAGKSTIARRVAQGAGLMLVDTGAIYRAVAVRARREEVGTEDEPRLAALARSLELRFVLDGGDNRVFDGATEITREIREAQISMAASDVSQHPEVRAALLELQRHLGRQDPGAVLEGRDIGTVVFPDADVKIFLTATAEERARRRAMELDERGQGIRFDAVLDDIRRRDRQDTERAVAPLRQADDAVRLDSTCMTMTEVVDAILAVIASRRAEAES